MMITKSPEILIQRINQLMEARYLKKKDVAERLGMEYLTFWRKLKGKRGVDALLLSRLAEILGTSVSYLIGETDNPYINTNNNNNEKNLIQISLGDIAGLDEKKEKISFAYWGKVADSARDVADNGDSDEINYVYQMLNQALSFLATKIDKRATSYSVVDKSPVTNMPVMNGKHNENNLTVVR